MTNKFKIFTGVASLLIIVFFTWFLSNDIFSGDDIPSLVQWLTDGGTYNTDGVISAILTHIVGRDIPLVFHINPHLYSMTIGAFIRAFDTALLCLLISSFAFIGRKKSLVFPFLTLFSALYFCYAGANLDFINTNSNNLPPSDLDGSYILLTEFSQHFGQLFNLIIGLGFLYLVINFFCQNKLPDEKYLVPLTLLSFVTAMSSMFVNVVCGVVLLFAAVYLIILNRGKISELIQKKTVLFPLISYVAGSIVFAFYPGYLKFFSVNSDFLNTSKVIIVNILKSNSLETALIIILSAMLYLLALHKSTFIKRTLFVVFSVLIGAFVYFNLFSVLDKNIILQLSESHVLLRLVMYSMILLLAGACFREHSSEPKELKTLTVLLSLVLISFSFVQVPFIYSSMFIWRNMSEETKNTTYCLEKMYRFYSLMNKTAILPEDSLVKIFKVDMFTNDKKVNPEENITNRTFFKHTYFTDNYYSTFYKNANIVSYIFIDSKTALKIFFEEGGIIDAEEMKHINFQNLYNDKFVLNRAIEKSRD